VYKKWKYFPKENDFFGLWCIINGKYFPKENERFYSGKKNHKFPQNFYQKIKASGDLGPRAGLPLKPFSHANVY
jgi:hypothetical protein